MAGENKVDLNKVTETPQAKTGSMRERVIFREKKHEDELLRKIKSEQATQKVAKIDNALKTTSTSATNSEADLLKQVKDSDNSDVFVEDILKDNGTAESLMITSAVPLTDDEKEKIVRKFIEKTDKTLKRITTVVDANLITGIRLQSESFYYENSAQKTLRELQSYIERTWTQEDELN